MEGTARRINTPIAKRLKGALGHAAGAAGLFACAFRTKTIIMTFHRVRDDMPEDGMTCGSAKFEHFCNFFRTYFRVVPLSEQVAGCSAGKDMGGTLSITLDDGYRDNFEVAAPILRRMGLPAAFFVTTGFIGTRTVAPWDRDLAQQPGWMDWDQVRSLATHGFEIGCHTDTHIDMGTAYAEPVRAELDVSKRKLREQLGKSPKLFAYPFGGRNNICERSLLLVREAGFVCCLSCFGGSNAPPASPFSLARIGFGPGFVSPDQFGFDLLVGRI
jgi:peptidoglycan/xylan/chitin deacetylase (PgdA/CDA1 family)